MSIAPRATIDDLYRFDGNAELIGGRILALGAKGRRPSLLTSRIFRRLDDYCDGTGVGEAYTSGIGFAVPELASGRESFLPDVSYYVGPFPKNDMRFIESAPTFAVEVRSDNDYHATAERAIVAKREDYFEAGTLVVWDVDPLGETITCYRAVDPTHGTVFRRASVADAEPAVLGWRVDVDDIFAGLART